MLLVCFGNIVLLLWLLLLLPIGDEMLELFPGAGVESEFIVRGLEKTGDCQVSYFKILRIYVQFS